MTRRSSTLAALGVALGAVAGAWPAPARAVFGTPDNHPAMSMLLPWFEVDPRPDGDDVTTRLTIVNGSQTAIMVRVQLWTDLGVPTFAFDLYLTGLDMEVVDLRQLLAFGVWPRTASDGQDPADTISPQGEVSQDINFGTCAGLLPPAPLDAAARSALVAAHTGQASALLGGDCGSVAGDGRARGYVTADLMVACITGNAGTPLWLDRMLKLSSAPSFVSSQMTGRWEHIDVPAGIDVAAPTLMIEADQVAASARQTFYGSLLGWSGADNREPLPSRWRTLFAGAADAKASVIVWREPDGPRAPFACGSPPAGLGQRRLRLWDAAGALTEPSGAPFSRVTQRVPLASLGFGATSGVLDFDLRAPAGTAAGPPGPDPTRRSSAVYVLIEDGAASLLARGTAMPTEVP